MKISKLAVIGCLAIMGPLALFSPQQVHAETTTQCVTFIGSSTVECTPPYGITVDRLNQLCIEEWQKSHAFREQGCRGIWVSWDSYRPTSYDLASETSLYYHQVFSRCRVNVKCDKGLTGTTLKQGLLNDLVDFFEVHKLVRCRENSGQTIQDISYCHPLTDADIEAAIEDTQSYEDEKYGEGYSGEVFGE